VAAVQVIASVVGGKLTGAVVERKARATDAAR
jgi:hypothetical protein